MTFGIGTVLNGLAFPSAVRTIEFVLRRHIRRRNEQQRNT